MKRTALYVTVLSTFLSACPEDTPPPVEEIGEHATLTINNGNAPDSAFPERYAINLVLFRGPYDGDFGANMLDPGEIVAPGGSAVFFLPTEGNEGAWVVQIGYQGSAGVPSGYLIERRFEGVASGGVYVWDWTSPLKEVWRQWLWQPAVVTSGPR